MLAQSLLHLYSEQDNHMLLLSKYTFKIVFLMKAEYLRKYI